MSNGFKYSVVSVSTVLVALLLIGAVLGQSPETNPADPYRHLNVYTEVFAKVKADYVEEPDVKNVTLGAVNGLLVSLDPFASYLNAEQYKQYLKVKSVPKADVGLMLSRKYGYEIGVVDAIPGSPADKAGLSTGDILEAINGISTRDMPLAYADVLLHGEPGSTLELTVLRLRKPEPTKITLTRTRVDPPALTSKMLDKELGYLTVEDLSAGKTQAVQSAIAALEKQGAKKIILDLRDSALNVPEEGITLANLFVDKGTLGSLSGQKVAKQVFAADPAKSVFKGPLVVLTNRGTSGAAEIAAAALLDNKRASVVGERTYGDAALRKAVATEDGGAVLLAVAKYYSPAGKAIQDSSVVPNFLVADKEPEVATDEDDTTPAPTTPKEPKSTEDSILKKAIEVVNGKAQASNSVDVKQGDATVMRPLNIPAPKN
ncbi:S41 family peptidase [uncultured Paludibaculum sp.]|uniref:S41 family peptidase n=1 Tax=uncultured Paludibaculum sp. TaxID=1765020 RepID=UPI002AAB8BDA|nr:S41 family peptidase [uncultured Paludibaculum sp.]